MAKGGFEASAPDPNAHRERYINHLKVVTYFAVALVIFLVLACIALFIKIFALDEENEKEKNAIFVGCMTLIDTVHMLAVGMLFSGITWAKPLLVQAYIGINTIWVLIFALIIVVFVVFSNKDYASIGIFATYLVIAIIVEIAVFYLFTVLAKDKNNLPPHQRKKYNILLKTGTKDDIPMTFGRKVFQTDQSVTDDFRTLRFNETIRK